MRRPSPARLPTLGVKTRRFAELLCALAFVLVATGVRLWAGRWLPSLTVFSLFYPAILGAALVGGEVAGAIALVAGVAMSWTFFRHAQGPVFGAVDTGFNLLVFTLAGGFIAAVGARLRGLLRRRKADLARLADREARYRTLFEGVSEGFALLEGIWNDDGRLVDFVLIEANPALLRMFGVDTSVIGKRQSELVRNPDPAYLAANERAFHGQAGEFELYLRRAQRWFEIHVSRVGENRLAQIVVDITLRKAAESRRAEMFDELNHRVKNNLAAVSAMLGMQARLTENEQVREHLRKAVDRIQTIGDVHDSLYRASSADDVDFAAYLRRLCERLSTTLVDPERVRLEVEADPVMAPLDEAVALGLIVNELVTNAAKYAYPPPSRGVIRVSLRNTPSGLSLSVSDEGEGLPETGEPAGIGMRLVRSLVQQCHGELEVKRGLGASFTVRLPVHGLPPPESAQNRLL